MTRTRIALALGALGIVALSVSPALADPPTGPDLEVGGSGVTTGQELLQDPVGEAEDIVTETTQQAEDIVDETAETAEETIDETTTVVDKTVDQVKETVGDVVGGGTQPDPEGPPAAGDPPVTDRSSDPRRYGSDRDRGSSNDRRGDSVLSHRASRAQNEVAAPRTSSVARKPLPTAGEVTIERAAPRLDVSPITPREAAEKLAFPLLMTLAMAAFLVLQGRFDRRDPKLVLQVDVEGERLAFE